MKIKVCGMRDSKNVDAIGALNPDYLGFIFYDRSPRYVGKDFDPGIIDRARQAARTTAVFVNTANTEIIQLHELYKFDLVQLHGNETADQCKRLRDSGITVIKAFGVDSEFPSDRVSAYKDSVNYFLFDTKTVNHGGSGRKFNWQILNQYGHDIPFFLSGGIGPGDIHEVLNYSHAKLYAIDLNSQFELSPGYKDQDTLSDFLDTIRHEVSSR